MLIKTFLGDLYGEETPEKELLNYWSFRRMKKIKLPTEPWTNKARSDYNPPEHVDELLAVSALLRTQNVITFHSKISQKHIYGHWIGPLRRRS